MTSEITRLEVRLAEAHSELNTIRAAAPWSKDDEEFLARMRAVGVSPPIIRLCRMLEAHHDENAYLRTLLEDRCRDLGLIAADGLGWRQAGAEEMRMALAAWCWKQAILMADVLPDHIDTWYGQVADFLLANRLLLPSLSPSSVARIRADEAVALLRRLLTATDDHVLAATITEARGFLERQGEATP